MIRDQLASLLADYLPRQRWYAGEPSGSAAVEITEFEVWAEGADGAPGLVWLLCRSGGATYQMMVGLRALEQDERFLEGKGRSLLGDVDGGDDVGPLLAYDALVDPELAVAVLTRVAPGEHVERVRALTVEQSNTSVVYDERIILKLFRRVADGPNPDVEVPDALNRVGFAHVPALVGVLRSGDRDLAVARAFLEGASEGWSLALASLRDVYASRVEPERAGGDMGPEARRLGEITAELHLALARAFGAERASAGALAGSLAAAMPADGADDPLLEPARAAYRALAEVADAGLVTRVHGDYHLAQVLRVDTGWYVLDFEGEPATPLAERRQFSSPLRDVAGMLRSFHYAAEVTRRDQGEQGETDEIRALALQWEAHASEAFLDGYLSVEGIDGLLPPAGAARDTVLAAFVAAKAVYEVAYERAYRPAWADIPLAALARL